MPLMTRTSMDPRWAWHQRSVPNGAMQAVVEIYRHGGNVTDYGFDPASGNLIDVTTGQPPEIVLLYRGKARSATNMDWRARTQTSRGDSGTVHAVRFQIPLRTSPVVFQHDIIRIVEDKAKPEIGMYLYHVRNPMASSSAWDRNLLCDVDVAHRQFPLPEPFTADVVPEDQLPPPATSCPHCG